MQEQKVTINHLEKAKFALHTLTNTTSQNTQYCEGLLKRANTEALVAIAEELHMLNEKLCKIAPHDAVLTERVQ